MQDVLLVEVPGQAGALLHPLRLEVLKRLSEPRSCPDLARELAETTQKVYYHVKILQSAGLVDMVDERRVRGIHEGLYRARAKSYWLSPRLVHQVGGRERARDRSSLDYLLNLAEDIQSDVARLAERPEGERVPSLGLSFRIGLADEPSRTRFLSELQTLFQDLARKYGAGSSEPGASFQISVACYPRSGGQTGG
jgi:DNA-binding transcriptional ArsR family regulator